MDSTNDFLYLGSRSSENWAFYMEWYDRKRNYHEMVFINKILCYECPFNGIGGLKRWINEAKKDGGRK